MILTTYVLYGYVVCFLHIILLKKFKHENRISLITQKYKQMLIFWILWHLVCFLFDIIYFGILKLFWSFFFLFYRNYRFMAYGQYSAWVHHYEVLGRGKRIIIPGCVISRVCGEFPSPTNNYTGFKEFVDLELWIHYYYFFNWKDVHILQTFESYKYYII